MVNRLLVGILGIIVLLLVFLKGEITFLIFTEIVICISLFEYFRMIARKNKKGYPIYALIIGAILPILVYYKTGYEAHLVILSMLVLGIYQVLTHNINKSMQKIAYTLLGILYIPASFSYIIKLKQLNNGVEIVLLTFLMIWACDSFAYLFGITIGKHKFSLISPNKSIEGLVGGFIGTLLFARYFGYIYYILTSIFSNFSFLGIYPKFVEFFPHYSIRLIIFSILVTIFAVLGDLFESKLKREFEIKDSSRILLDHGGFLDRFDSALFVIPLVYIIHPLF